MAKKTGKGKAVRKAAPNKGIKVVFVYFMHSKKKYFFGSVSGIFQKFTEEEVGCTYETLRHRLLGDSSSHLTSRAYFYCSRLIRNSTLE